MAAISPWVARNLEYAQYAQHRGSQYEGQTPQSEPTYIVNEDWDEPTDNSPAALAHADHFGIYGIRIEGCHYCDKEAA